MDRIKSAYEMALERFKQRKEVPQSEIDRMEYVPVGKALAANFLREKNYDITAEINKYPNDIKVYLIEGAQETFLSNISLPIEISTMKTNKRAIEGLVKIKKNKQAVKEVCNQLEHLFRYYGQAMAQTYSQFKDNFTSRINETVNLMEKRTGTKIKVDPEKQPGFREEWMKFCGRLNRQYEGILTEQKEKLRNIK